MGKQTIFIYLFILSKHLTINVHQQNFLSLGFVAQKVREFFVHLGEFAACSLRDRKFRNCENVSFSVSESKCVLMAYNQESRSTMEVFNVDLNLYLAKYITIYVYCYWKVQ